MFAWPATRWTNWQGRTDHPSSLELPEIAVDAAFTKVGGRARLCYPLVKEGYYVLCLVPQRRGLRVCGQVNPLGLRIKHRASTRSLDPDRVFLVHSFIHQVVGLLGKPICPVAQWRLSLCANSDNEDFRGWEARSSSCWGERVRD